MAELKRKFYDKLMQWKNARHKDCLLVKGARQIGKTFIIEKFGREQYESFIEFNFILDPDAGSLFDGSLKSDDLYRKISAYDATRRILPGRTLIFLDEIQECANARTALKSFAIDGRCDVIASGSLLGIKYKNKKNRDRREPKSIPVGYERQLTMHSLDFEEFLWARGITEEAVAVLKGYCDRREIVPEAVNRRYSDLLREYMIVGGMPTVVKAYVEAGDFGPVQEEQEKILASYVDDIHKYADTTDIPKIEACYRAIPRLLAKENRKFKYAEVEKGGEVALEQFHLTYRLNNAFMVRVGHQVVPVGLTNAHHEPILFFGTVRPEGETTILPSTWHETGLSILGQAGRRWASFDYQAMIVAGLNANGFDRNTWVAGGKQGLFETDNFGVHIQGIIGSHYFLPQQPAVLKVLGIFIISQVRGLALPFVNETSIIVGKPVKPVNRFGKELLPEESFQ